MYRLIMFCVLGVCLISIFPGCGPGQTKTYHVEGMITINGKPTENVLVTFTPKTEGNGIQASGVTDAQGVYKLTSLRGKQNRGAAIGEYAVTVSKMNSRPLPKPYYEPLTKKEFTEEYFEIMPIQYRNPLKSPLSAEVTKGENKGIDFDIQLK